MYIEERVKHPAESRADSREPRPGSTMDCRREEKMAHMSHAPISSGVGPEGLRKALSAASAALIFYWVVALAGTDSRYNVYVLVACVAGASLLDNFSSCRRVRSRRELVVVVLLSVLFACAVCLANYSLYRTYAQLALHLVSGFFVSTNILLAMYALFDRRSGEDGGAGDVRPGKVFLGSFLAMGAVWLAYLFLIGFPGTLTPDSINQLQQVVAGSYSNHHPFWHTVVVGFWFRLGCALSGGDANIGAAFYSVFQCLLLALCQAYAVMTVRQMGLSRAKTILLVIVIAFVPYNIVYATSIWKDIVFGACLLALVTAMVRLIAGVGAHPLVDGVVLAAAALGFGLFRGNGFYALALTLTAYVLVLLVRGGGVFQERCPV